MTPSDAATVMLVRDAEDRDGAVEVCMLRRNLASEFVAGAYVFPGGSVDPEDRSPSAAALCHGLSDAEASAIVGMTSGGLAFWVAAVRECFEEAGVLLAGPGGEPEGFGPLDTSDPETARRFETHRLGINEGRTGLLDVCREEGLLIAADGVHYVSRWITPDLAPRRYDTRFFVAAAPPHQVASHDDGETIASIWIRPDDALARFAAGELELLPPTVSNLTALARHASADEVLAWARTVTDVPTVLPVVLIEDGRLLILRPGDEGYEQAIEARLASDQPVSPELAAFVRDRWGPKAAPDPA